MWVGSLQAGGSRTLNLLGNASSFLQLWVYPTGLGREVATAMARLPRVTSGWDGYLSRDLQPQQWETTLDVLGAIHHHLLDSCVWPASVSSRQLNREVCSA